MPHSGEGCGSTLAELVMVIAMPGFRGRRHGVQDRAAHADPGNVLPSGLAPTNPLHSASAASDAVPMMERSAPGAAGGGRLA